MPYLSNCHTHTLFCDGKADPETMAAAAAAFPMSPSASPPIPPCRRKTDWALPWDRTEEYLSALSALKERYRGKLEILTGIELDADTPSSFPLSPYGVAILSLHTLHTENGAFSVDYTPELFAQGLVRMFGGDVAALWKAYYRALPENILKPRAFAPGCLLTVGHFDLLTKYNGSGRFFDENDPLYKKTAINALDRIMDSPIGKSLFFEVNTGAMARSGRSVPYPAPFLLRELCRRGAKMVMNTDAHRPEHLDVGYPTALALLAQAGFREIYRFRGDGEGVRAEALPLSAL